MSSLGSELVDFDRADRSTPVDVLVREEPDDEEEDDEEDEDDEDADEGNSDGYSE